MLKEVLILLIAYLLGSLSPSYFIAWLKGFDLRKKGTKNLGASNAFLVLGKFYGVLVCLFDVSKGILAVLLAYYFGLTETFYYLAGLSAVLGHIFPFYLNFKGGKGVATAIGAVISFLFLELTYKKWIVLLAFLFGSLMSLYRVKKHKKINLNRKIYRSFAFIFPISYFFVETNFMLWFLGIILVIFLVLDLLRLYSSNFNQKLFKSLKSVVKKKEKKNLSTTSYLLISFLLSVYFFDKNIVILAMFFSILGDGIAEIYGKCYGKYKLLGNKTLAGSLAGLVYCAFLGIVLNQFYNINYSLISIGVISTTIIELISTRIDDNLTMPLGISLVLFFFSKLIGA